MFYWKCPYCKKSAREIGIGDRRTDHALHAKLCDSAKTIVVNNKDIGKAEPKPEPVESKPEPEVTPPVVMKEDSITKFNRLVHLMSGGIDYKALNKTVNLRDANDVTVSVIIPVRGRVEFHQILVDHLRASFARNHGMTMSITFVEHSANPDHKDAAEASQSNYIHIPTDGVFNKCLCFNVGFLFANKAEHYLLHDLDCMVQSSFWFNLFKNLERGQHRALQSFRDRRVLYCDETLTPRILNGQVRIDSLDATSHNVMEPARHQWKAPGGSIFCSRDQFIEVGGFDPEYFFGYSIEDGFFYNKLEMTGGIGSCNNPEIEIFHLYHPPLWNSNPHLESHHAIYNDWMSMDAEDKIKLMGAKSVHLKKFIR